ncbi:MAG: tRNA lysidine(34) synthetase TilS [Bacteroidales bacterium]|nr:tRNA lysidine(34) synthetase TilS [Bacteroidales bacterium]
MLDEFLAFVAKHNLFDKDSRLLVALSGGMDSSVLCRLLHEGGFRFAVAHCNFHLRPGDCDRDEAFVRSLAARYGVECHVAQFDTTAYAAAHHLSIEEAARQLRYDFFRQLAAQMGYCAIATAHHADDSVETFFLNLLRGTGISGLHGILPSHDGIVRPLLPFSRSQIEAYATANNVSHVEDCTNADTRYRRNAIRHQLMPLLRSLSPSVDSVMLANIDRMRDVELVYRSAVEAVRRQLLRSDGDTAIVDLQGLLALQEPRRTYLYELMAPYGFSFHDAATLLAMPPASSGQQLLSPTHKLLKNRTQLLITPRHAPQAGAPRELSYQSCLSGVAVPLDGALLQLSLGPYDGTPLRQPSNTALINADGLAWPLRLRHWRKGDRFKPFGMKGSQLLSNYFSNHKFSLLQKEQAWLLTDSNDAILWLVGHRAADHTRITPATKQLLFAQLLPQTDTNSVVST